MAKVCFSRRSKTPILHQRAKKRQRLRILERDNYTCQICGLYDKEILHLDHKIPRYKAPELLEDDSNCWLLCPNCHARKTRAEYIELMNKLYKKK